MVAVETRVRTEQIRLLYEQGFLALVINGVVAVLLVLLIGPHVARSSLLAWCLCFAFAWALRGVLHVWRRRAPDSLEPQTWLRLFAVATLLAGATWGLTALWLFPTSTTDRFLDAVAIMGLASGAAASLSCVRGIYPLYLVPAFLPVAVRFAFESDTQAWGILALSVLYCVGMSVAANMNYRQLTASLRLRYENDDLVQRLEGLATHDPLTGLANRRMLMDHLDEALRRAHRSQSMVAVAFVDIDGFKKINDTYGHAAGDTFLKHVADALVRCVRETDTVARFGGDEFVVILEEVANLDALEQVIARMSARASQTIDIAGAALAPRVSIGVSRYPGDGTDSTMLIRNADQAMYNAKRSGGNLASYWTNALG